MEKVTIRREKRTQIYPIVIFSLTFYDLLPMIGEKQHSAMNFWQYKNFMVPGSENATFKLSFKKLQCEIWVVLSYFLFNFFKFINFFFLSWNLKKKCFPYLNMLYKYFLDSYHYWFFSWCKYLNSRVFFFSIRVR